MSAYCDVTVVTPTVPARATLLDEAEESVARQTVLPRLHLVSADLAGEGAAATRNRALADVDTRWVAFLDDDDLLLPGHLAALLRHAELTGADVVYPWFEWEENGRPGRDPLVGFRDAFDPDRLRRESYIPVTTLVRTELASAVGGFPVAGPIHEDWGFLLRLLDVGASFAHLPQKTWVWRHHGGNTGGALWTDVPGGGAPSL